MIRFILLLFISNSFALNDFSSPESTVKFYQLSYDNGDQEAVARSFDPIEKDFYIAPKSQRSRVTNCKIKKTKKYSDAEIKKRRDLGIVPQLKMGDMKVTQICIIDGKRTQEFYFDLRKIGEDWKIISNSAAGVP